MPILNTLSVQTGLVGVLPSLCYIYTDDPIATVTTVGYLNKAVENGFSPSLPCLAIVSTQESLTAPVVVAAFSLTHVSGNWTLSESNSGQVIFPVTPGDFAIWANTGGGLQDVGYSPTTPSLSKVAMLQGNNSGATPLAGNLPVYFDTNGSIAQQQPGVPSYVPGPLYCYSSTAAHHFGVNLQTGGTPTAFGSSIQGLNNLAQNTIYWMVDPASANATLATFATNPASVTAGHLVVSGTIPGTLVDGGAPPSGFVTRSGTSAMSSGSFIDFDTEIATISGSDTVTINRQSGRIQSNTLSTAAGSQYTFTLNNSLLTANSNIQLQLQYGSNTTTNVEIALFSPPAAGALPITLINHNSAALNGNLIIYFFVSS